MVKSVRKKTDMVVLEKSVYDASLDRFRYLYDNFDTVVVSFSGGKDSMAILEVALVVARERNEPLNAVFWDEEALLDPTVEYIQSVANRPDVNFFWYCVPFRCRNSASRSEPFFYPWNPAKRDVWCRDLPPEAITNFDGFVPGGGHSDQAVQVWPPEVYGRVALALGRRAEESVQRYNIYALARHAPMWIGRGAKGPGSNIYLCDPLYDWHVYDVWLAAKKYGWEYNKAYDWLTRYGWPLRKQRLAHIFTEESAFAGPVWQQLDPIMWDRLVSRVDGAATLGRYGDTKLYKPSAVDKRDDQTWEDRTYELIDEWAPNIGTLLQTEIARLIEQHANQTGRPITQDEPDITTGICWRGFAKMAQKGDYKGRMRRTHFITMAKRAQKEAGVTHEEILEHDEGEYE